MYTQRTRILPLLVGAFGGVWGTGTASAQIADSRLDIWGVSPNPMTDELTAFQNMVLGLLEQLEGVLDEDWTERDQGQDDVEEAAAGFVLAYEWVGVAQELTPQEAAEADQTAELTKTAVVCPESGLTGTVLSELLNTLAALRTDLIDASAGARAGGAR